MFFFADTRRTTGPFNQFLSISFEVRIGHLSAFTLLAFCVEANTGTVRPITPVNRGDNDLFALSLTRPTACSYMLDIDQSKGGDLAAGAHTTSKGALARKRTPGNKMEGTKMSKNPRRRKPPTERKTQIEKLEVDKFARRLHDLMNEQGLSQSDLARKAFGTTIDKRGYHVARNRDRVSVYLRGTSLPDPKNLARLADALGVDPDELTPDITVAAIDRENPEVAMTAIAGHSDKVHLRVNKLMPLSLASKIISMISEFDEANCPT